MFLRSQKQVAVIPNHWSGSLQHYYHFLLGYLAPIVLWPGRKNIDQLVVRDCGPMNRWFEALSPNVDVEVVPPGFLLHALAGKSMPHKILRGYDFPGEFSRKKISAFRDYMITVLTSEATGSLEATALTVVDRGSSESFYSSSESEIPGAGADRRSVPNLSDWVDEISPRVKAHLLDAAVLPVEEQVRSFASTRILVGQHGAGLANMVFMPPGGVVVEIQPPLVGEQIPIFQLLARNCGHAYERVHQADSHSNVDPNQLWSAIKDKLP